MARKLEHQYVALLGLTGSGKTKFISEILEEDVGIGLSLHSETKNIQLHSFVHDGKLVTLMDTPGLDDTFIPEDEILHAIASAFCGLFDMKMQFAGVLYFHRISGVRAGGSVITGFQILKGLCGINFAPNITFVTTFWDLARDKNAEMALEDREQDLRQNYLSSFLEANASIQRHNNTRQSAVRILESVLKKPQVKYQVLTIQDEAAVRGKPLFLTTAGTVLDHKLLMIEERYLKELEDLEKEGMTAAPMDTASIMNDIKAQKEKLKAVEDKRKRLQRRKGINTMGSSGN